MSVHCAVCGHPLAAADMACPTCLPNFYKSKADKLLRGEGYPPATDFTNMTTEPSDIVERLESALAHFVASEVEGMTSYTSEMLREAAAEITRLRAALAAAKTKLKLYRAQHSGEYIGGMEYGMLLDMINEVLGESKYDR